MVRLTKHLKKIKGGAPPFLNLNLNAGTPMEVVGSTPQVQSVANIQRQMRQSIGIQANTPTSMEEELSKRHAPVVATPILAPVEKKPGFFNLLFGRTRKNISGEKKLGFFNRLFGRTQKKNLPGEKKPGFFNRLFGRTKKNVQVAPVPITPKPTLHISPSPPSLQPPNLPPSPPKVSQPATPKAVIPPPPIRIPRRFNLESNYVSNIPNAELNKILMEEYYRCVLRTAWYLKKRLEGRTHKDLLPYLDVPGSMVITKEEIQELGNKLRPYIDLLEQNKKVEANALKVAMFGQFIDSQESSWEKGERVDPADDVQLHWKLEKATTDAEKQKIVQEIAALNKKNKDIMNRYCSKKGRCVLYKDTPQVVTAHGNVGNGLDRFIVRNLFDFDFIRSRTNIWRASFCDSANDDCYLAHTLPILKELESNNIINLREPSLQVLCIKDPEKLFTSRPSFLNYDMLLSTQPILNEFLNQSVYFISPLLAVRIATEAPELLSEAFGLAIRWKNLSRAVLVRLFAVQYYTALELAFQTNEPDLAKKVFETYPQPALGLLMTLPADKAQDFSKYFMEVQKLAGVPLISFQKYLLQLKKLKNIQLRKTIRRNVPINQVGNWSGKTKKTANNLRRNAAIRAITEARLKNKSIASYGERISGAAPTYKTQSIPADAKTQQELQRRLNAGFGKYSGPSGVKPSAYEAIPNW